jgi:hypothetical protein
MAWKHVSIVLIPFFQQVEFNFPPLECESELVTSFHEQSVVEAMVYDFWV